MPYHSQSSGDLENSHRTLGEYLLSFVAKDQLNWGSYIPFAMFTYNILAITYQQDINRTNLSMEDKSVFRQRCQNLQNLSVSTIINMS